jgi:alpha-amylase
MFQYPQIKINLHFSGNLLEWFETKQQHILKLIKELVKRGQAELVGGAIYEPILPIIPERDRVGQIKLMRDSINSLFNTVTKGAWIPERVWEPHLISSLAEAGIEYIILDDTHLVYAGIKQEDTYGYYISEDNGSIIRIFPSNKHLRYAIPFCEPEESLAYLKTEATGKINPIFTYGDDAEKFGEWPGTYKLMYEDKWLLRFLEKLSENSYWLQTSTLSECIRDNLPLGNVYLPTASYEEMLEWALPTKTEIIYQKIKNDIEKENKKEQYLPFIRGGFFRNFLAKYYEVNQMHKRMLYVSNLLVELKTEGSMAEDLKEAHKELYKAQCNCAYWHGLFGGIYLYHLRRAVYRHLLRSEKIYNDIRGYRKNSRQRIMDFDADGFDEVILQNKNIWLCVKPSSGGTVVEFDLKDETVNLMNVLTRYEEAYHREITYGFKKREDTQLRLRSKGERVIPRLFYDKYRRSMFVDHFFGKGVTLHKFEEANYIEEGDFINSFYDFKPTSNTGLIMERIGMVNGAKIRFVKVLTLKDLNLNITYTIDNLDCSRKEFWFGTEIPFIMPDADSKRYVYRVNNKRDITFAIDSKGATDRLSHLEIVDKMGGFGLSFEFSKDSLLWRFPITTISQSEKGYEENYQGSVIVPNWHFILDASETLSLQISFNLTNLKLD